MIVARGLGQGGSGTLVGYGLGISEIIVIPDPGPEYEPLRHYQFDAMILTHVRY